MKLRKSSKDINLKIQEAYPSTRALKNILSSVFSFLCASVKRGSGLGMKIEKTLVFLEMSCGWACVLSCFSRAPLCVTLWTLARQALLSMGFSKQEHWSGLPFSPPQNLPDSGIEPMSLTFPALTGGCFTTLTYIFYIYIF